MPKWPRLEDPWSEKDVAEAVMVNSLHIDASDRHRHKMKERGHWGRTLLPWSRLIEALDLSNFDDDIRELSSTADAWKPLPAVVQLWFALLGLELR